METLLDKPAPIDKSGWQTCPYCHQKIPVPIAQHTARKGRCWAFDLVVSQWRIVLRGEK
jgi:hypothetical protein